MSHCTKKTVEVKDKSTFFAARTPQNKHADNHSEIQAQDGAGSDPDTDQMETAEKLDSLITPTLLQAMLDAAVTKMQITVTEAIADLKKDLTDLDIQTSHLEEKVDVINAAHITLGDCLNTLQDKLFMHEVKLANVEDRSSRNNLRLHGVSEEVGAQDLTAFTTVILSYPAGLTTQYVPFGSHT
ncbi:Hypothetical predicted protein [Pelobates cultripes]|uniref:Uncharacterized protein n=1 Tax=Pelobates cultripes TaxID=61616 RepID=A0AAD1WZU8_PELCU|nr:Hypothetical predicted protein [Pelobates cultripes]